MEEEFDLGSYGITQEDVYKTMFPAPNLSYSQSPKVELRLMIAKERAAKEEEGRQIATATLPYVQQDIVASQRNQIDIKSKIDQALGVLNAPPPQQTNQFNEAEMYAGAIGGLLSGGQNIPDLLNALSQVSGARNKMEFDNKLREYGLTRETAGVALQQFADRLKDEQVNERYMAETNRKFEIDQAAKKVQSDKEARQGRVDFDGHIRNMNQGNMPGDARRAWELASDLDPDRAAKYFPQMEAQEKLLTDKWNDQDRQRKTKEETDNLRLEHLKVIFPDEEQLKKLGVTRAGLANEAAQLGINHAKIMNPLQEEYMKVRNKWADQTFAAAVNVKQYMAELAGVRYQLSIQQFGETQSQHLRAIAATSQKEVVTSLRKKQAENVSRLNKLNDSYPRDLFKQHTPEEWKALMATAGANANDWAMAKEEWLRIQNEMKGAGGLEEQIRSAEKALNDLSSTPIIPTSSFEIPTMNFDPTKQPPLRGAIGGGAPPKSKSKPGKLPSGWGESGG